MIRAASYCRISTDKDDQANSFETQQRYFREYIERHPEWELFKVYADEGVTGTSTKKRSQFNQMMTDARSGKFQLLITKEVSRFSRNLLDTIAYTRELKAMGVAVLFVTDGIHTMDPDAELRLSIMASIAQEESRRTSARVTWGQQRQMEKGVVFGHSLLGYHVRNGEITVNPTEAGTVRLIFQKYALEQMSSGKIADFLNREEYPAAGSTGRWSAGTVLKILKNEKYVGDLVQRKTYTADYLTHEKRRNKGEIPYICIKDHHEAIVDRDVWSLAQERLERNNRHAAATGGHSVRFTFSGKIKCGECGSYFAARKKYRGDGSFYRRWSCSAACRGKCSVGRLLRDDDAMRMVKSVLQSLTMDREGVVGKVSALALETTAGKTQTRQLSIAIAQTERKREAVLDSYFSGDISREDMLTMKGQYEEQLELLQAQQRKAEELTAGEDILKAELISILRGETESDIFYQSILESITVFKNRQMELRLRHLPVVFHFSG